jgi:hypothetical protein
MIQKELHEPAATMLGDYEQALDPPVVPAAKVAPFGHHGSARHNEAARGLAYPVGGETWTLERASDATRHTRRVLFKAFRFVSFLPLTKARNSKNN